MALPSKPFANSLSLRLLSFAGGTIALALVVAWLVLGALFERHAERQLEAELDRHGIALIAALRLDPQGLPRLDRQPTDPRFERPASGLYWRLEAPAGELRSRSLWDGRIAPTTAPQTTGWTTGMASGPFEDEVMVAARIVRPDPTGPKVQVIIAADRAPLTAARSAFEQETAVFLAALWLMLALAAWVQVQLGLRPLAGVRGELDAMSQAADVRLDAGAHPVEIRPLTLAINRVAQQRAEDIVRARQRARDLAHALKTPLTALRLDLDSLPPEAARRLTHSLSLLSGAVESELARTGAQSPAGETPLGRLVERITAVVSRTPDGQRIGFTSAIPFDFRIPMTEDAALETLGALIENAARHAREQVAVSAGEQAGERWIAVEDDGPGIPPTLHESALARGRQLDERSGSHGLGLAIAQDFLLATGGRLELAEAGLGGLAVRITWPDAHHAPDAIQLVRG